MSAPIHSHNPRAARHRWLAIGVLMLAVVAAYANSLHGPFISDDGPAIPGNPTIHHLWPLTDVLLPQAEGGLTVSGRPVLNLSLAINYAISGEAVWSYHVVNVLIHAGSALLLFGLVRRTLKRWSALPAQSLSNGLSTRFPESENGQRVEGNALHLAFVIALLWALHPLQTQAVTYIVQRAESLMGFFYLLTLYAFVRGTVCHPLDDKRIFAHEGKFEVCHLMDDKRALRMRGAWRTLGVAACALGMGTKEVMATAPLMVLLYDRTFVAGSFGAAWRERRGFYLGLAATWLLLAALVWSTGGNRGGTVGVGVGVPWWAYGLTQFQAVARYLALSFWPQPLVFEYGQFWVQRAGDILPYALVVLPLMIGTAIALWRRSAIGFFGAWFFGMLAPSSLTPGTIQMIVEHRPYLSLAAAVALVVISVHRWLGPRVLVGCVAIAVVLGALTARRNRDYVSAISIWADTVAKRPDNARARDALADVLAQADRIDEAIVQYREAVRLKPDEPTFHHKLAARLAQAGQFGEALPHYAVAVQAQPDDAGLRTDFASAQRLAGRVDEAKATYVEVLRRTPDHAGAHFKLGNLLIETDRVSAAVPHYEAALRLKPDDAEAHHNLGVAYARLDRFVDARREFETAVRLKPDYPEARRHLEQVRALLGR